MWKNLFSFKRKDDKIHEQAVRSTTHNHPKAKDLGDLKNQVSTGESIECGRLPHFNKDISELSQNRIEGMQFGSTRHTDQILSANVSLKKQVLNSNRAAGLHPTSRSVLNASGPLLSSPLLPKIKRAIELNESFGGTTSSNNKTKVTRSFSLNYGPTHPTRSSPGKLPTVRLQGGPTVLDISHRIRHNTNTVKVAPPEFIHLSSPSFRMSPAKPVNQVPLVDTQTVLTALRERRKRSNLIEEENIAEGDVLQTAKRRRQDSSQSSSSSVSMPTMLEIMPDLTRHKESFSSLLQLENTSRKRPSAPSSEPFEDSNAAISHPSGLRKEQRSSILSSLSSSKRAAEKQIVTETPTSKRSKTRPCLDNPKSDVLKQTNSGSALDTSLPLQHTTSSSQRNGSLDFREFKDTSLSTPVKTKAQSSDSKTASTNAKDHNPQNRFLSIHPSFNSSAMKALHSMAMLSADDLERDRREENLRRVHDVLAYLDEDENGDKFPKKAENPLSSFNSLLGSSILAEASSYLSSGPAKSATTLSAQAPSLNTSPGNKISSVPTALTNTFVSLSSEMPISSAVTSKCISSLTSETGLTSSSRPVECFSGLPSIFSVASTSLPSDLKTAVTTTTPLTVSSSPKVTSGGPASVQEYTFKPVFGAPPTLSNVSKDFKSTSSLDAFPLGTTSEASSQPQGSIADLNTIKVTVASNLNFGGSISTPSTGGELQNISSSTCASTFAPTFSFGAALGSSSSQTTNSKAGFTFRVADSGLQSSSNATSGLTFGTVTNSIPLGNSSSSGLTLGTATNSTTFGKTSASSVPSSVEFKLSSTNADVTPSGSGGFTFGQTAQHFSSTSDLSSSDKTLQPQQPFGKTATQVSGSLTGSAGASSVAFGGFGQNLPQTSVSALNHTSTTTPTSNSFSFGTPVSSNMTFSFGNQSTTAGQTAASASTLSSSFSAQGPPLFGISSNTVDQSATTTTTTSSAGSFGTPVSSSSLGFSFKTSAGISKGNSAFSFSTAAPNTSATSFTVLGAAGKNSGFGAPVTTSAPSAVFNFGNSSGTSPNSGMTIGDSLKTAAGSGSTSNNVFSFGTSSSETVSSAGSPFAFNKPLTSTPTAGTFSFGTTNTSTGTFGTTHTGTGAFGMANTGTGMFGTASMGLGAFGTVNTGTGTFGTASTGTGTFGTANTGTGAFGTSNAGTGAFGTANTGTGAFGTANAGTGAFGTANAGTGAFGTANAGTGAFGTANTGSGAFGTANTGTGVFGTSNTGNGAFGTANMGTGAFGAANTGVGAFRTGAFSAANTGTGAFGTSNQQQQKLFNNTAPFSFASAPPQQQAGFGGEKSLSFRNSPASTGFNFGSTPNTSTSVFGSSVLATSQPPPPYGSVTLPTTSGSTLVMFGASANQNSSAAMPTTAKTASFTFGTAGGAQPSTPFQFGISQQSQSSIPQFTQQAGSSTSGFDFSAAVGGTPQFNFGSPSPGQAMFSTGVGSTAPKHRPPSSRRRGNKR